MCNKCYLFLCVILAYLIKTKTIYLLIEYNNNNQNNATVIPLNTLYCSLMKCKKSNQIPLVYHYVYININIYKIVHNIPK